MADEKPKFDKQKPMSYPEFKELVDNYRKVKVHQMDAGRYFIVKILGNIQTEEYEDDDVTRHTNWFDAEYMSSELTAPAKVKVQIGDSIAKRFQEKYKPEEYIGKHVLISKTKFKKKINGKDEIVYPQQMHMLKGEFSSDGILKKEDVFVEKGEENPIAQEDVAQAFDEGFDTEFLKTFNESFPSLTKDSMKSSAFVGAYLKNAFKDDPKVKHALELFGKLN